jgi:hypothetical protein
MIQSPLSAESIQTTPGDTTLVDRIRDKLALVISDPRNIEVKAKDGIVTLSGQLRDAAQCRAASLITHRVDGVTNVVNKLTIGRGWSITVNGSASRPAARRSKQGGSSKQAIAPGPNGVAAASD